jgi:hypothetical protein
MSYCFRYRVKMTTPIQTKADEPCVLTVAGVPSLTVLVKDNDRGIGSWAIFIGCGYESEAKAKQAGESFGDTLLIVGATSKSGIDLGFSRNTLQFSDQIHSAVKERTGTELRGEVHGLMVYEENTVGVIGVSAHLSVHVSVNAFEERMSRWIKHNNPLTERQRNCAALLNDAFFVSNTEGQFILRVSAIEALCEQSQVGVEYQTIIDRLSTYLAALDCNKSARTTVEQLLEIARRQSVRQAYMGKIRKYLTDDKAIAFDSLYNKRSKLIHDGEGRGDLSSASEETLRLAVELFEAELVSQ